MSYAISNDNSNSSLMAEIFNRRTQENSAPQENQEKPQNKIADTHAHANNEVSANSTEYPRPSMNALMFIDEQSSASEIKDKQSATSAIEEVLEEVMETEQETQEVEKEEEKKYYMLGDPRAEEEGNYEYNYNKFPIGPALGSPEHQAMWKATYQFIAEFEKDSSYNDAKFLADYGAEALESLQLGAKSIELIQERASLVDKEFRLTLQEFGIIPTIENIYALTEDMELLGQIQERLNERMAEHGIYPAPEYDVTIDHATQTVTAKDPITGEVVGSDKFEYWNGQR